MDASDYAVPGTLRDGTPVTIRAIRPDDREALREGFSLLSERTVYHRFFQTKHHLTDGELRYLTELDFHNHVGLVVTIGNRAGELIIAVGRVVRLGSGRAGVRGADRPGTPQHAEVAFVVADEFQGQGVGSTLLWHLAAIARELDIRYLDAEVLPGNRPMLDVFEHSGLPITETTREGLLHVELRLDEEWPPARPVTAAQT